MTDYEGGAALRRHRARRWGSPAGCWLWAIALTALLAIGGEPASALLALAVAVGLWGRCDG